MPTDAGPPRSTSSALRAAHPLRDATILVSGATGEVGRALLTRLLEIGAKPAIAVRRAWQVAPLREALGGSAGLVAVVGARDGEAAAGFVKGANDSLGPVRALISTAGRFRATELGRDPAGEDGELLEANLLCVHNLVRAVVGPMKRRRSGSIVVTGSVAVGHGGAGLALYLASKAALHEYARAIALELAPHGVGVTLVLPGVIDTSGNRGAMPNDDRSSWAPVGEVVARLIDGALATPGTNPPADPLVRLTVPASPGV